MSHPPGLGPRPAHLLCSLLCEPPCASPAPGTPDPPCSAASCFRAPGSSASVPDSAYVRPHIAPAQSALDSVLPLCYRWGWPAASCLGGRVWTLLVASDVNLPSGSCIEGRFSCLGDFFVVKWSHVTAGQSLLELSRAAWR